MNITAPEGEEVGGLGELGVPPLLTVESLKKLRRLIPRIFVVVFKRSIRMGFRVVNQGLLK